MARKSVEENAAWAAKESSGDWRALTHPIQVPESTAYRWIAQGGHIDRCGNKYNVKMLEVH